METEGKGAAVLGHVRGGVAAAAAAALNTNDYYVQPVSGQLEIQSTLRILDGAKVCLQPEKNRERAGKARQAKGQSKSSRGVEGSGGRVGRVLG